MIDFEALREIEQADVYLGDHAVATLARDGDEIEFSYTGPTPTSDIAVREQAVSWSLLRDSQYPLVTHGGAVPPFFAGLLPEGVRLGIVTTSTKTSADDHFTLLLAIGSDTIGNIRVLPAGTAAPALTPMFDPEQSNDFRAVFASLTGSVAADPVGLPGVQPKVSAAMWSTPARTTSGAAILKLNPPKGFPRLVENEHFFMRMAAGCGPRQRSTPWVTPALAAVGHGQLPLLSCCES